MSSIPNDDFQRELDAAWEVVSVALAAGVRTGKGRSVDDAFLLVLDDWVKERVLAGDRSDLARCRLRPRFKHLRDEHAAFDFLSEIQLERLLQFKAGNLDDPKFRDLDRRAGMAQIAATQFLVNRSRSFLGKEAAGGMLGMPEADRMLASLDAGEDGGLGAGIEASTARDADRLRDMPDSGLGVMAHLVEGRPVLVLELAEASGAIVETAGLQLRRRLDPEAPTSDDAIRKAEDRLAVPLPEVDAALDAATQAHRARIETLRQRCWDHPNMTRRTAEDIERQIVEAMAASLLWPIWGREVAVLFGLSSENAGQQRVTKYRKALPVLLPALAASHAMISGSVEEAES